jgi:WD40 repeat protein
VLSAAFSPDGKRVVTVSADKTARIWDAAAAKGIAVLRGHDGFVLSAAFSPDGKRISRLAPKGDDGRFELYVAMNRRSDWHAW